MKRIMTACVALVLMGCVEDTDRQASAARGFAQGYEVMGVNCTNMDSDGDGYVSCTVRAKGEPEPLAVECASQWTIFKQGCRLQKPGSGRRPR